jgi:16S rRNA (cytosine967-C5)-methyltransferase
LSKSSFDNARLAALAILSEVLDSHKSLAEADSDSRVQSARDRAFAMHLSYGVLRWLTALEWLSGKLLRKPLRRKDRDIQRLILIGLYQLWQDGGADHAATHATAECAKKLKKAWAVPVINAVLRRFQREKTELIRLLDQREERLAHPGWLLDSLKHDWPEHWQQIARANQQPGALWLRLNRRCDATETINDLSAAGFDVDRHVTLEDAVKVSPAAAVTRLPGFEKGRFSVQDPAAQLAAGLLDIQGHHAVLDACAAPGGKTCHILEKEPGVKLTVIDRSQSRLTQVEENMDRLQLRDKQNQRLVTADAADTNEWWDGSFFDRILLDAPCTATGVIRRHPEIKWLRSRDQVQEAVTLQAKLLQRLWSLLTPGGILLYATCSVLRLENNAQIQAFLEKQPDAHAEQLDVSWGEHQDNGRQIFPGDQEMDGFFYARLKKSH